MSNFLEAFYLKSYKIIGKYSNIVLQGLSIDVLNCVPTIFIPPGSQSGNGQTTQQPIILLGQAERQYNPIRTDLLRVVFVIIVYMYIHIQSLLVFHRVRINCINYYCVFGSPADQRSRCCIKKDQFVIRIGVGALGWMADG